MTIAIGCLLLLTDGTASLGGVLGVTAQFQLERWVLETTGAVPNILVLAIVLMTGAAVWVGFRMQSSA